VKEALRVFSPVPMGLSRVAPRGGLDVGGRIIPAGTIVSINPWVIHHSKELWGKDADQFNPDRWLVSDPTHLDKYFILVSDATSILAVLTRCSSVQDMVRALAKI
jgi:cytochrome P450